MTLDDLSSAFAELLGRGDEPYDESATVKVEQPETALPGTPEGTDDDCCEITPRSILEAMLFVGNPDGSSLSATRVASLMRGVRAAEIEEFVAELNEQYAANRCPYHIVTDANGYRLTLREELGELREAFQGRSQGRRLSPAAIEVLSIVAYRGPIGGDAVSKLRGRPSSGLLAQLVRRELLKIERKKGEKRPPRYVVTDRLLKLAGLSSLEDLPRSQDLDAK
jgi:segregation and condensation protein B